MTIAKLSTDQQLLELISKALIESEILNEKEAYSLKSRILAGKIKSEDWNMAIENSLLNKTEET